MSLKQMVNGSAYTVGLYIVALGRTGFATALKNLESPEAILRFFRT